MDLGRKNLDDRGARYEEHVESHLKDFIWNILSKPLNRSLTNLQSFGQNFWHLSFRLVESVFQRR